MHYIYNFNTVKEKFGIKVYNALVENFSKTFFVGGTVRDMLLQKTVHDIDIATIATPEQVAAALHANSITFDNANQKFGIITAKQNKDSVEITTLRKDIYTNSRYPKITYVTDIIADSKRRDFTINSLYFSPILQKILDPNKGVIDLENHVIRFIGDAQKRITEDPLRIMRAFRFQLELQFGFEIKTAHALQKNLHLINTISQRKLLSEIKKISSKHLQQKLLQVMHKNP
ncbi:MAG: hypothetical protein M3Q64_02140 [bacterium]|nr:hypothetical protein [bacterium]